MAADAQAQPIIVKRIVKGGDGHHGGAWKVAYADFVTAMMAFFLLLWLLGATTEAQRDGIADYFSPNIPLIDSSGGGASVFNGDTVFAAADRARSGEGGVDDIVEDGLEEGDSGAPGPAAGEDDVVQIIDFLSPAEALTDEQIQAEVAAQLERERAALAEEREELERLRAELAAAAQAGGGAASIGARDGGLGEATPPAQTAAEAAARDAQSAVADATAADIAGDIAAEIAEEIARRTGDAEGEAAREAAAFDRIESAFASLKEQESGDSALRHLSLRRTPDGLTIEIAETDGEALFSSASATPSARLRALVGVIAPIIDAVANDVAVVGHTDATPFRGTDYTNWELSMDRANAARRLLLGLGLDPDRFVKVTGAADRDPLSDDPFDPRNRRIAITLLTKTPQ